MSSRIPDDARHEVKFIAYDSNVAELRNWVMAHRAAFYRPYPSRRINNVYFDTFTYEAYEGNISGESKRQKVRFRWYGEDRTPKPGTLEVKCRFNSLGWKLNYKVPELAYQDGDTWRKIIRELRSHLPEEGRLWLDANPQAVLLNSYRRDYFVSRNNLVRVTIDVDQRVWDQRLKPTPNTTREANMPKTTVVEVKCDRRDRQLASDYIQGIPLRVGRYSKYIVGTTALLP